MQGNLVRLLGSPESFCSGEDTSFGTIRNPVEVGSQSRRHGEVKVAEKLIAVFAVEFQAERAKGASFSVTSSGVQGRVEGTNLPRAFGVVWAFGQAENLAGMLGGRVRSTV